MLKPGAVTSSVTVTEAPVAVEFNSSNKDLTIDTKMAEETPRLDRNPFKLTLLAPSAVNTRGEMQPYHSWSMNSVDLGGGTNLANDLQVDGSPIGLGHKGSYPPNTDAVQEVIVSQNSVDAEVGPQRRRPDFHDDEGRHERLARNGFLRRPLSLAERRSRPYEEQPELSTPAYDGVHSRQPDPQE